LFEGQSSKHTLYFLELLFLRLYTPLIVEVLVTCINMKKVTSPLLTRGKCTPKFLGVYDFQGQERVKLPPINITLFLWGSLV